MALGILLVERERERVSDLIGPRLRVTLPTWWCGPLRARATLPPRLSPCSWPSALPLSAHPSSSLGCESPFSYSPRIRTQLVEFPDSRDCCPVVLLLTRAQRTISSNFQGALLKNILILLTPQRNNRLPLPRRNITAYIHCTKTKPLTSPELKQNCLPRAQSEVMLLTLLS